MCEFVIYFGECDVVGIKCIGCLFGGDVEVGGGGIDCLVGCGECGCGGVCGF